jgi:hypothetical protein
MLNHVKCQNCGTKFNGKSGGSNNGGVAAYLIVTGLISCALMFAVFFFLFGR